MKNKFLPLTLFLAFASPLFAQDEAQAEESPMAKISQAFLNLPEEQRKSYQEHSAKAAQFFRQKRTFECLDEIHKASKIFDSDPNLWNLKGSCHVEFRDFSKAKKAYQKALALNGENTGILFNLAEMDFVMKNWKGSKKQFALLREKLEPADGKELEGPQLALHRLAVFKELLSEIKLNNLAGAQKLAEDYEADWDDTPFSYYSKATFAFHEGDEVGATEWLQSAVRVFGGVQRVANWHDTLIEFGYIKSFYGGAEGE